MIDDIPDTIILGMHRSGTSALAGSLAGSLARFGLSLGPEAALMPPTQDNPKGYFENLGLVEISDWLLQQQGLAWWNPVGFDRARVDPAVLEAATRAYRDILAGFPAGLPRMVKDPRLSITLGVLLPAFRSPAIVCVWREPNEVAASLNKRDSFPNHMSSALWEYCVVSAARIAVRRPSLVVSYRELVDDADACLQRIAEFLERQGVPRKASEAAAGADHQSAGAFVDKSLRRASGWALPSEQVEGPGQRKIVEALAAGDLAAIAGMAVSEWSLTVLKDFAAYQGVVSSMASDLRNTRVDARQLRAALETQSRSARNWEERARKAEAALGLVKTG